MSALDQRPVGTDDAPAVSKRTRHVKGTRPSWFVYACLGVVLVASMFPFYWSLLIGSGDSYTIRDPNMSWIPGGNFFANAAQVFDAIPFWLALGNSFLISGIITVSVVTFSTLAGYAFAKLRFKGRDGLMIFVIAIDSLVTLIEKRLLVWKPQQNARTV